MSRMKMWHPDVPSTIEDPVDVDERSFEITWSKPQPPHRPEGWRRWTSAEAAREGREDEPEPEGPQAPPRIGAGSGRDNWLAYAEELGIQLEDGLGKHDIIKAITEPQAPPRTGAGSGRDKWQAYADALGIQADGLSKPEIIKAIADHQQTEE